jgi:hypothetical protein
MRSPIKIASTGVTINATTAALTTPTVLPTNGSGEFPRAVLATVDTGVVYVKLGGINTPGSAMTPTLNDLMVNSTEPVLLNTRGQAVVNVITRTGTANINFAPVEA